MIIVPCPFCRMRLHTRHCVACQKGVSIRLPLHTLPRQWGIDGYGKPFYNHVNVCEDCMETHGRKYLTRYLTEELSR